jgi:hypothetical protein
MQHEQENDEDITVEQEPPVVRKHSAVPPPLPKNLSKPSVQVTQATQALQAQPRQMDEESWINSLSPRARAVLRAARRPKPAWPRVPRIIGAVALPIE